jgi:hypothetical protein
VILTQQLAAFAERFLSERSFDLIVAPAIADVEFENVYPAGFGGAISVFRAVAGAAYEDITNDLRNTFTFLLLAFIPAFYYAFLFMLCLPAGLSDVVLDGGMLLFLAGVLLLSTSSAVVCYWPERPTSRNTAGTT